MLPEAGRNRSLPAALFNDRYLFREAFTKYARYLARRDVAKLFAKQERIAECRRVYRRVRASQDARNLFAVALNGIRAPRGAQEDLMESELILGSEALRIGCEIGRELLAVDGTRIKAVNNKDRNFTRASLTKFIELADAKLDDYLQRLDQSDATESKTGGSRRYGTVRC